MGAVCALVIQVPQTATQTPSPREEARLPELLATASTVVRNLPELGRLWPGFWPPGQPFILTDSARLAVLYTPGSVPPGFEPVPEGHGVPGAPGNLFLYRGRVPGLGASLGLMDLHYAVPGGKAVAVPLGNDLHSTLRFLFHEGFHAFQERAFTTPNVRDVVIHEAEVTDSATVALWERERGILGQALATDENAVLQSLLREYVAVRSRRVARVSDEAARYEADLERIEGSAEWVGRLAASAAVGGDPGTLAASLRDELQRPIRVPRFASGGHWIVRLRVYATGAALCALLERLEVDWRDEVASGRSLLAVLTDTLDAEQRGDRPAGRHPPD